MIKSIITDLERIYAIFDRDGGGVSVGELASALKRLGRRPPEDELFVAMGTSFKYVSFGALNTCLILI